MAAKRSIDERFLLAAGALEHFIAHVVKATCTVRPGTNKLSIGASVNGLCPELPSNASEPALAANATKQSLHGLSSTAARPPIRLRAAPSWRKGVVATCIKDDQLQQLGLANRLLQPCQRDTLMSAASLLLISASTGTR